MLSSSNMAYMRWGGRTAELIEDWQYLIRRYGWRSALPIVGKEVSHLPYRQLGFTIFARSLTEPLADLRPNISLEVHPFEPADLELVRQINRPSEARACARRLARGHRGLIAFYQGQPAGYAWGCAEVASTLERVHLRLDPGDILCVDAFTALSFRGQGIHTALSLARFRLFRDLGYRRAVAYIEKDNAPSLTVWRKVGGQEIGRIDFLRIGPWRRTRYQ